ncbi:NepR family anti-sigma factor [Jannaschia donghaensis]|uniref:Anti-sigma factor NepR domain-containing protein n=1 Tax=Jannaschia donghaensis TaxID=420998 RepID=A0A0M6YCL1_9RHOB|nr:NepR family anti-sigma factor [Jannaschia donghaensis]CTQ48088.1 hypothetical protein JDO7802_00089 [Jannaschia donghaensis]
MTEPDDAKDDRICALIDDNLKRVYSDIVQEELPDRFKDLLAVLKAQDADKPGHGSKDPL